MIFEQLKRIIYTVLFVTCFLWAQTTKELINILNANNLEYDEGVIDAQILTGNVQFEHNKSRMNCDSANFYQKTNSLHAFGKVRIFQADSLNITADTLYYEGNTSLARLRGRIAMRKNFTTLYTDTLDYNMKTETAYYYQRGKIVSEKDKNTIESIKGTFFSAQQNFLFEQEVVVRNEKYTMTSDSLKYNTGNKTAYFIAPTIIVSDSNKIFTSAGYYNTEFEFAKLAKDNSLLSGEQKLVGDYIFYDRNANIGEAFGNVVLIDTLKKIDIYGHQGVFFEKSGYSIFTKSPYVRVLTRKTDSLYILADTLYTQKDSILRYIEPPIAKEENQTLKKEPLKTIDSSTNQPSGSSTHRQIIRILAYNNAKSYNDNIQSYSDSLVYSDIDSTLRLYKSPFLWATAKNSQVSGDSIVLKFAKDNQLHQLDVFAPKPLSISKPFDPDEVSEEYNQVLSQHITTYFKEDSKPREIVYTGPIQSIFYLGDEQQAENNPADKIWEKFGMDKTSSVLDMKVGFGFSGEPERIVFIKNPRSVVYPMDSIPEKEKFLEGFNWKIELKPESYQAIKAPYLSKVEEYTAYYPKIEDFIAPELANILRRELGVYQESKTDKQKKKQKEKKQKK